MATTTKKKSEPPRKKEIIDVLAVTTDEEILALEGRDYKLRFSEKDFRPLSDDVIAQLSMENARDYWVCKGAFDALKKNAQRKEMGFDGVEVIPDPFKSRPRSKLKVGGIPKGWFHIWRRPDEVEDWKKMGAVLTPPEVEAPGASKTSTSKVITRKDGTDDLVSMMIPERLHFQHLEANALQSKKNAGATLKEVAQHVAQANRHLEDVADLPGVTETTSTEEVTIRTDMRR